jgi:peptidyl-prolyl cis-trans isomerase B (cyclophilin B)
VQLGGFVEGLVPKPSERQVPYEGDNGRSNLRGTVGMARLDDPDSASTQFYVNLGDNGSLDHRDPRAGYAVFGEVVEGLPVLHALATAEIDKSAAMPSVPARDIVVDEALRGSVGAPPDTGTAFP